MKTAPWMYAFTGTAKGLKGGGGGGGGGMGVTVPLETNKLKQGQSDASQFAKLLLRKQMTPKPDCHHKPPPSDKVD